MLPAWVSPEPGALERFQREARAASALNHPNICTLYDIREDAGHQFLVLELLEGQNMQGRLAEGPLPVPELLVVAAQISDALDAAHRKGIVHRDLKPANIFLQADGRAKILDFGIARYTEERSTAADDATVSMLTREESFIGTPAYASPEQIRGDLVDCRTDLFSLGLTLYEMATGKPPYPGASLGRMIAENPGTKIEAPSRRRKKLPAALDGIILKLLEADPGRRYRSAAELREALGELRSRGRRRARAILAATAVLIVGAALWAWTLGRKAPASFEYARLTNFPDSVHSPVLSKDGKLLLFVRGGDPFNFGPGEIYLKTLPDGQPVQLTHDHQPKMAPVLSPDGSRVVYTSFTGQWSTMSVPISGGPPSLLMQNAASLTWTGSNRVLFSQIKSINSLQMGIVSATESRAEPRDVYLPTSPVGMAHFSLLSPDAKWLLVVEMDMNGWLPCRLVPFDGTSAGKPVGPNAGCTAAAWSPDGRWMYFVAAVGGESHIWRQAFPDGRPQQITFGVTEERGIAVDPDGRSVITSVGAMQGTVLYHDASGDRAVSVEGYAFRPQVSHDGRKVYYLVRRAAKEAFWIGELWSAEVASGRSELMLPGFLVRNYHVSADDRQVVFDAFDASGQSRLWIAPADRSAPPKKLSADTAAPEQRPFFGASGDIYFLQEQPQGVRLLFRMKADGSGRRLLRSDAVTYLVNISPDEKWAMVWKRNAALNTIALAIDGGDIEKVICSCATEPIFQDSPRVNWSGDGRLTFINVRARSHHGGSSSITVPVERGGLPASPPEPEPEDLMKIAGASEITELSVTPGPVGGSYAYVRETQQRNLFRLRLP